MAGTPSSDTSVHVPRAPRSHVGAPAIHGVLVTYRRPDDLATMFGQLAGQGRRLDTLVVVDNDPDESAREPTARFTGCRQRRHVAGDGGVAHGDDRDTRVTYVASGANLNGQGHRLGAARLVARSLAKPIYNLPRNPRLAARHLALNTRAIHDAHRGRMGVTVSPGTTP